MSCVLSSTGRKEESHAGWCLSLRNDARERRRSIVEVSVEVEEEVEVEVEVEGEEEEEEEEGDGDEGEKGTVEKGNCEGGKGGGTGAGAASSQARYSPKYEVRKSHIVDARMPRALPTRRGLQALALVLATAYVTILLYQAVAPRQWIEEISSEVNGRNEPLIEVSAPRRIVIGEGGSAMTPPLATATMVPFSTNLDDVFISVKTTKHYHRSRLPAIIGTWFQFAKDQTWFFTDREDPYFQNQTMQPRARYATVDDEEEEEEVKREENTRDVENLRSSRSSWKHSRSRILSTEIYLQSRTNVRTVDRALSYKIGFHKFAFGLGLLGEIVRVFRHNDVPPESKVDGDRIEDDRDEKKEEKHASPRGSSDASRIWSTLSILKSMISDGHMIDTKCSSSHNRRALCCKMSVEFDRFLESGRKWFCHFDDDNYVNVPRLLKLLDNYNPREDWYLGRPSIPAPLEIIRQGPEPSKRPFSSLSSPPSANARQDVEAAGLASPATPHGCGTIFRRARLWSSFVDDGTPRGLHVLVYYICSRNLETSRGGRYRRRYITGPFQFRNKLPMNRKAETYDQRYKQENVSAYA
uniref:Fringe-like glycosyltransferase domain-containing protein n=1 Tax=Vespula pensylvanica TaxID=30213 RepID=A0A834P1F1_VESPE|nr:hypothetical protein H0235_007493 [Vespula pensylvanica]